jgi:hypothetical protein
MPSQLELLKQMDVVLERLLENAKKLNDGAKVKLAKNELEVLQERQNEIMHELNELDKLLKQSPPGAKVEELDLVRVKVREKLAHFQVINNEFFNRVQANMRVIEKSLLDSQENK